MWTLKKCKYGFEKICKRNEGFVVLTYHQVNHISPDKNKGFYRTTHFTAVCRPQIFTVMSHQINNIGFKEKITKSTLLNVIIK